MVNLETSYNNYINSKDMEIVAKAAAEDDAAAAAAKEEELNAAIDELIGKKADHDKTTVELSKQYEAKKAERQEKVQNSQKDNAKTDNKDKKQTKWEQFKSNVGAVKDAAANKLNQAKEAVFGTEDEKHAKEIAKRDSESAKMQEAIEKKTAAKEKTMQKMNDKAEKSKAFAEETKKDTSEAKEQYDTDVNTGKNIRAEQVTQIETVQANLTAARTNLQNTLSQSKYDQAGQAAAQQLSGIIENVGKAVSGASDISAANASFNGQNSYTASYASGEEPLELKNNTALNSLKAAEGAAKSGDTIAEGLRSATVGAATAVGAAVGGVAGAAAGAALAKGAVEADRANADGQITKEEFKHIASSAVVAGGAATVGASLSGVIGKADAVGTVGKEIASMAKEVIVKSVEEIGIKAGDAVAEGKSVGEGLQNVSLKNALVNAAGSYVGGKGVQVIKSIDIVQDTLGNVLGDETAAMLDDAINKIAESVVQGGNSSTSRLQSA